MSKFSEFFIHTYPQFKEKVLEGNYRDALVIYMIAYQKKVEGKKNQDNIHQVFSAAYDGFNRHGSRREQNIRSWIDNDRAFDGFLDYFKSRYGKEGVYRVSNKSKWATSITKVRPMKKVEQKKKEPKEEGPYERFFNRKHLRMLIYRVTKNSVTEKKKLYVQIEEYIREVIIATNLKELTWAIKGDLEKERNRLLKDVERKPYLVSDSAWLDFLMIRIENVEKAIFSAVFNYLRWYAARYINKKGLGDNIPTNALTSSLKRSPILFLILNKSEMKFFLRSFLSRKKRNETMTEKYNAILINIALYVGNDEYDTDDTLEKIPVPESIPAPVTIKEAKTLINYREKAITLFEKLKPAYKYLDMRFLSALELILKCRYPFLLLMQKHKAFIDSATDIDIQNHEECVRTLMRLVGIYTFCSRIKYMSRYSYYCYQNEKNIAKPKEEGWIRVPDPSLEYFVLNVVNNTYYNFNQCKNEKYKSYIDTVLKLYPREEYVYIKPDYSFPTGTFDTYLTGDEYTLARYTFSGKLCSEPLTGNCVKRITDPDFIPEPYRTAGTTLEKMDDYLKPDYLGENSN